MRYHFQCKQCPSAPTQEVDGKPVHVNVEFDVDVPITKAPALGSMRKCPCCKRKTAERVIDGAPMFHVKGSIHDWKPGETMRMKMNGLDYGFSFVDHPHTDPKFQRNLAELAGRANIGGNAHGLSNARYDEKSGRMVVDVMSDIKDPLGAVERAKKSGTYTKETRRINTPVKVRGKKKR